VESVKNILVAFQKKNFLLFSFIFSSRKQCGCGNKLAANNAIDGNRYVSDSKCKNSCNSGDDTYCGDDGYGAIYTITNSTGILC